MRTEEPNLRCCRDGFSQDLQTFAPMSSPASTLTPVMFLPAERCWPQCQKERIAITATIGIVSLAAFKLKTSRDAAATMIFGFVRTTSCESSV